jgi:hypothetical protein
MFDIDIGPSSNVGTGTRCDERRCVDVVDGCERELWCERCGETGVGGLVVPDDRDRLPSCCACGGADA